MAQSPSVSPSSLPTRKPSVLSANQAGVRWFEKHQSNLLKGAGVIFILLTCGFLLLAYQRHQQSVAREKLRVGIAEFQAQQWQAAIPLLEEAKELFPSDSGGALVAKFYLLEAYSREKEDRQPVASLLNQPLESNYLSQLVLVTAGKNAEKGNDYTAARKFYEDAAALEQGPFGADALLGLARMAETVGDTEAAQSAREKFLAAYPNSPLAELIRKKLGK